MHGIFHRPDAKLATHDPAALVTNDQPRVGQHGEVLHHRGQRHVERLRQRTDRDGFTTAQTRNQCPPRGVGQRRKDAVERSFVTLNHTVNCRHKGEFVNRKRIGALAAKSSIELDSRPRRGRSSHSHFVKTQDSVNRTALGSSAMDLSVRKFQWIRSPAVWEQNQIWRVRQQAATADYQSAQSAASDAFGTAHLNLATGLATIAARIANDRLTLKQQSLASLNKLV